ncbi:MAG: hypothetical protein ACLGIO_09950 [Acidimicrobiia bacterium]
MGAAVGAAWPTRRSLALVWAAAAVGFAALLVLADAAGGPLHDPDPARERPGVLDLDGLPAPAPQVVAGVPAPGRRAVVFFARPDGVAALCGALARGPLPSDVDVAVVASGDGASCGAGAALVVDPTVTYARRFGLDVPRDGGAPVGYAVVDAGGRIRYRTLDPGVGTRLGEVATIVAAAR